MRLRPDAGYVYRPMDTLPQMRAPKMIVTVELPLPPNVANARMHWAVKHHKRRDYIGTAQLLISAQVPAALRNASDAWTVRPILRVWNKMDRDNAVARLKWPIDALVRAGVLKDDSEQYCDLQWPRQVVDRSKGGRRLILELVPCRFSAFRR